MKTEYKRNNPNPCLSTTFPFFPFFPFKRKGSMFFRAGGSEKRVRVGGCGYVCLVGNKRKKRKKRNEKRQTIDTQGLGVFRFLFRFSFRFPFGGVGLYGTGSVRAKA
jgi:hypothetical protein